MSTALDPALSPATASLTPNRAAIWKRLLWKDFRELLPIWLTLLLGAAVCFFLINLSPLFGGRHTDSFTFSTQICSQVFAVLSCLFNGVLLFALERENRTHQLLLGLPVQPSRVVWTKLALGFAGSILLILLFTWGGSWMTCCASGSWPKTGLLVAAESNRQAILLIGPITFFLIGVVAALIAGSTVYAFVIGGFLLFVAALGSGYIGIDRQFYSNPELLPAIILLVISIGLLGIVAWQARRWIEGRPVKLPRLFPIRSETVAIDQAAASIVLPRRRSLLPVLLWQSWLVAWPTLLLLVATVVIPVASLIVWPDEHPVSQAALPYALAAFAVGFQLLFSATVFLSDHQQATYRFFQQHVEQPRWFWFTRLIPWWLTLALIAAGLSTFLDLTYGDAPQNHFDEREEFLLQLASHRGGYLFAGLLTALAIGQFWSMFVRNFAIAMVFSLVTGGIVCNYVAWLVYLGESLTWFLMPLTAALFWATWYRSKYWLADDRRWIGYIVPVSTITATAAMLLSGFVYHRANSIPEPKFDVNNIAVTLETPIDQRDWGLRELQFGTQTERAETAELYRQALEKLKDVSFEHMYHSHHMRQSWNAAKQERAEAIDRGPDVSSRLAFPNYDRRVARLVEDNQDAIDLVLEASERVGCAPFLDPNSLFKRSDQAGQLTSLMMANALVALDGEKIDKAQDAIFAFDRTRQRTSLGRQYGSYRESLQDVYELLIRWGEMPGQTVESLQPVIRLLERSVDKEQPRPDVHVVATKAKKSSESTRQGWINHHWHNYRHWGGEREWFSLIHQLQEIEEGPEDQRLNPPLEGVVAYLSAEQRSKRLHKQIAVERFSDRYWNNAHRRPKLEPLPWGSYSEHAWPTSISAADRRVYQLEDRATPYQQHRYRMVVEEPPRRYTLVRLALMAYRAEHGSYPERLESLAVYFQVNGNLGYQTAIPKTTIGRQNFAWFPDGLPENVFHGRHSDAIEIQPNRPVLFRFAVERPINFDQREEFEIQDGETEVTKQGTRLPVVPETSRWFDSTTDIYLPESRP